MEYQEQQFYGRGRARGRGFISPNYRGRNPRPYGGYRRNSRSRRRNNSNGSDRSRSNSGARAAVVPLDISIVQSVDAAGKLVIPRSSIKEGNTMFNRLGAKWAVEGYRGRVMYSIDFPQDAEAYGYTKADAAGKIFKTMKEAEDWWKSLCPFTEILRMSDTNVAVCPAVELIKTDSNKTVTSVVYVDEKSAVAERVTQVSAALEKVNVKKDDGFELN